MKRNLLCLVPAFALALTFSSCSTRTKPSDDLPGIKNVILMIGDGMGTTQIYAAMTVAGHPLNIEQFSYNGFSKTYSLSDYITDSAAGASAFSTGHKTKNGTLSEDTLGHPLKTILEIAEDHGLATGLVSTSAITHATPAAFIAHQADRNSFEGIASDFLATDIDVFIGGGMDHFARRSDGLNLVDSLRAKGYQVAETIADAEKVQTGKLAGLLGPDHLPSVNSGRGDMLPRATAEAIRLLSQDPDGFFLMVEGSQIDWGGHNNDISYVTSETIDFDDAIGKALEFAKKDGHTLVIVTADHETGGLAITGGNMEAHQLKASFATNDHTSVMVPVFAWGPGSEHFAGIYQNTSIFDKILQALGLDK